MNLKISLLSSVIGAALVSGCGFESELTQSENVVNTLQGQLIDSPVAGIGYRKTNVNGEVVEGVTDANGNYEFVRGDSIEFYIGEIAFPVVPAKGIVTPLSFFSTDNPNAENVANVARLLQSLDSDTTDDIITIHSSAAAVATVNAIGTDEEGNPVYPTPVEFFSQSAADFEQHVETWLGQATDNARTTLVSYDEAISHFVDSLAGLGDYKPQAFDPEDLDGEVINIFVDYSGVEAEVVQQVFTFTPELIAEEVQPNGTFIVSEEGAEVAAGTYELDYGRQVLVLNEMSDDTLVESHYMISLQASADKSYAVCLRDSSTVTSDTALPSAVNECETENLQDENQLLLDDDLLAEELEIMEAYVANLNEPKPALFEDFEVASANDFYSSNYKRVGESTSDGPLYQKTGGTPALGDGQLTLSSSARFTIGNTTPDVTTTSSDAKGTGIYNISQGFTISFDLIDYSSAGNFYIYIDNNTSSQGNSMHSNASKIQISLPFSDEYLDENGNFVYTADETTLAELKPSTTSFFQFRVDSSGAVTMDNLKIEVNAKVTITTDLPADELALNPGGDATSFEVTASKANGSAETVTVSSDNADVASVSIDGSTVTVTPGTQEGTTYIYVTSSSDPTVEQVIEVTVEKAFVDSTTDYGDLAGKLMPAAGEDQGYIDTLLTLEFDNEPTLGESGLVRIYDDSDVLVDELTLDGDMDTIKAVESGKQRLLNYESIYVEGKKLVIKPHYGVLEYGKTYKVLVGQNVVVDGQINNVAFDGLGSSSGWTFTTTSTMPSGTDILVDDDGDADFRTLQAALGYAMQDKNTPMTISIKDGVYKELLYLRSKNNLTIQGESRDGTVVQYNNYDGLNSGSSGRPVFLIETSDNLVLNNFTLQNTHKRTGEGDQAEALYFNRDSAHLIAANMAFKSEQDTLQVKGWVWFYNCLIEGNVDFIWGSPKAALFENSEIRTVGRSEVAPENSDGGYILQARAKAESDVGFVFLNSEFTSGNGPEGNGVNDNSTYFARSSGSSSYFDNITLINSKLGAHIAAAGWHIDPMPQPAQATASSGWREYGSTDASGTAADLSSRDGVAVASSDASAAPYATRADVFAADGWDPQPIDAPDLSGGDVAEPAAGDGGYAGDNFTLTGGANGTVVTVAEGDDLVAAIADAKANSTPVTIYVDGTITPANTGNATRNIEIKDIDNVSIIGVADRGEFDGIGLTIERADNIIIRNLTIHEVPATFGDAIGIDGEASNIWIDHNELYSTLTVPGLSDDEAKDYYDGLIDTKVDSANITISYNYIHDHHKTMLNGSSDDASEAGDRYITWHHNHFANLGSRVPLFRYGYGHLYNNYFSNITGSGINSRMGAELLVENNVFELVKNPIVSIDSNTVGYWYAQGNSFTGETWSSSFDADEASYKDQGAITSQLDPSTYVTYDYSAHLLDTADVKAHVLKHAGVGNIDQSGDTIPAIDDSNTGGDDGDTGGDTGTWALDLSSPITEDFSAADKATFFSSAYRDIDGGTDESKNPMYIVKAGNDAMVVSGGTLEMTGGRFSIGAVSDENTTDDAATSTKGVLDLSQEYTVTFTVVSVGGNTDKKFAIYVDNNTSGSSNSPLGGSSKFYSVALSEHAAGTTYTVDGLVATTTSFITLRTESEATIVLDDVIIAKK